ncbi:MAG: hypothetical protein GY861_21470 [bacterium]|nr:hypothetical protein [bacterium]
MFLIDSFWILEPGDKVTADIVTLTLEDDEKFKVADMSEAYILYLHLEDGQYYEVRKIDFVPESSLLFGKYFVKNL